MNPILRRVMGLQEHEAEDGKMLQAQVVYMTPDMLNKSGQTDPGARCGKCIFFNTPKSECFVTTPPACDGEHGVCAAFIGGKTFLKEAATPLELLPKEAVGYTEDGPTHCGVVVSQIGAELRYETHSCSPPLEHLPTSGWDVPDMPVPHLMHL